MSEIIKLAKREITKPSIVALKFSGDNIKDVEDFIGANHHEVIKTFDDEDNGHITERECHVFKSQLGPNIFIDVGEYIVIENGKILTMNDTAISLLYEKVGM